MSRKCPPKEFPFSSRSAFVFKNHLTETSESSTIFFGEVSTEVNLQPFLRRTFLDSTRHVFTRVFCASPRSLSTGRTGYPSGGAIPVQSS